MDVDGCIMLMDGDGFMVLMVPCKVEVTSLEGAVLDRYSKLSDRLGCSCCCCPGVGIDVELNTLLSFTTELSDVAYGSGAPYGFDEDELPYHP